MSTTFAGLGVSAELVSALADRGIDAPFPVQALTIPDAIAGRDVCGKARTGSGKTLAFGLPILQRLGEGRPEAPPRAVVLVPTRELALQVAEVLEPLAAAHDIAVRAVYGGTDIDRQIKRLRKAADLVVATPGRLIDLLDRGALSLDDVSIVVLDEADRMADMGFLPQVEWLLRRIPSERQTMLFSATLDGEVNHVVRVHLRQPVAHEVVDEPESVDNMVHHFLQVHELDKVKVVASIAGGVERCLVFVRTKRGADRLASQLTREGVEASPIHGDLRQSAREKSLNDFAAGKLHVLVATDVAARGIHVDEIDVVVHYDPPEDPKSYVHRSGRTARAGASGVVVTLVLWNQELEVEQLQRRLGLDRSLVEIFSNDPRLADLPAWNPAAV
jgi:superfamily II DNA/RNA helicase